MAPAIRTAICWLKSTQGGELSALGIKAVNNPIQRIDAVRQVQVRLVSGEVLEFDALNQMIGRVPRTQLLSKLELKHDHNNLLWVNERHWTSIPGLYAASSTQKALQLILVWVIPLIGAAVVLSVWAHDRKTSSRDPVHTGEGPWLPGIGPMSDSSHPTNSFGNTGTDSGDGGGGQGGD